MSEKSKIQWTDVTWNIARGCRKVDADCKNCYMYRESMDNTRYDPFHVKRTKTVFNLPLKVKEPSRIFTCSLTDFFIEEIDSYRDEAWDIIHKAPQHTYQILTKRPERIMDHLPPYFEEIKNSCWFGTSVGSQAGINRMVDLAACDIDCIKFLSLEPLYGEIDLSAAKLHFPKLKEDFYVLPAYDWVIIGGESGNDTGKSRYRPCDIKWMEKIIKDCNDNHIPVFVKQMGTYLSKAMGLKDRHGGNIDEWPKHLQIRNFPIRKK